MPRQTYQHQQNHIPRYRHYRCSLAKLITTSRYPRKHAVSICEDDCEASEGTPINMHTKRDVDASRGYWCALVANIHR